MTWRLMTRRAEVLGSLIARARSLIEDCEQADPQMAAVSSIVSRLGVGYGIAYVVGVALVSYMLATRGEDHWALAASHAEGNAKAALLSFVTSSPSLARFREVRVRRARVYAEKLMDKIARHYSAYAENLASLWRDLYTTLNARPEAKTIVFAVKMFYYAAKAAGLRCRLLPTLPVPVDYRVCLVTLTSLLVQGPAGDLRGNARTLRKEGAHLVRKGWSLVSKKAGLAPLNLDALLWTLGGAIDAAELRKDWTLVEFEKRLGRSLNRGEKELVSELLLALK